MISKDHSLLRRLRLPFGRGGTARTTVKEAQSTLWHLPGSRAGGSKPGGPEAERGRRNPASANRELRTAEKPEATARGVVVRSEIPLLTRYSTAYGLLDEWTAGYDCALKSDAYRLGEYVGDSVEVAGPLIEIISGMPVMNVTRLRLLRLKWMS